HVPRAAANDERLGRRIVADRVPLRGGQDRFRRRLVRVFRRGLRRLFPLALGHGFHDDLDEESFLGAALEAELSAEVAELSDVVASLAAAAEADDAVAAVHVELIAAAALAAAARGQTAVAAVILLAADEVPQAAAVKARLPVNRQRLLLNAQVLIQRLLADRLRNRNHQVRDRENAGDLLFHARLIRCDLDVIGADDVGHSGNRKSPQVNVEERTHRHAVEAGNGELLGLGGIELRGHVAERRLVDDERHFVLLGHVAEHFSERRSLQVLLVIDARPFDVRVVAEDGANLFLHLGRFGPENGVLVLLLAVASEFTPDGGRREVHRRLIGIRNVRLLDLHHGEQEAVVANADEFAPFAELRGLLANLVAGRDARRNVLAAGDPVVDHQLRFLVSQFEAGLLHELLEGIDLGLGAVFLGLTKVEGVEGLPGLGDLFAFGGGPALDLSPLAEHFVHLRGQGGGQRGAGRVADAAIAEHVV